MTDQLRESKPFDIIPEDNYRMNDKGFKRFVIIWGILVLALLTVLIIKML